MKINKSVYIVLIILVVVLIIGVVVWSFVHPVKSDVVPKASDVHVTAAPIAVSSLFKEEESVSCEVISDGLRDIGKLVSEEYYFTEVCEYSSEKTLFNIPIAITQSKFLISYDGLITAGVDFTKIDVEKDDVNKTISIAIPKSEIISTEIDTDSFQLFSEKEGLWNPVSIEDYNTSLSELTQNAREKALERGLLEKADENAKLVISNFVNSLIGTDGYTIVYSKK